MPLLNYVMKKMKKKLMKKNEMDIKEYFEGDLYKTAYKLETDTLSEKIANLVLHPGKTNTQKKLIKALQNHLKGA